jgi:hypothetical protein
VHEQTAERLVVLLGMTMQNGRTEFRDRMVLLIGQGRRSTGVETEVGKPVKSADLVSVV